MASKEVIASRIEGIDLIITTLQDIRRSEMMELEQIEAHITNSR